MVSHAQARTRLVEQYRAIPAGDPVRLAKRTSNLFRPRDRDRRTGAGRLGAGPRAQVDPAARTADVQAMTTYEHLVDATLAHGLMPTVVPQLKTITIGGAVTGLGIESSSFRNGLPHESVREIEVLTGDGEVVVAHPEGPDADLFRAFPNSYGTLGYALRLVIDLEPVHPFVRLRHVRFDDLDALTAAIGAIVADAAVRRGAGRLPRRHRLHRPTRPTSPSGPGPTRRRTPPTTPGNSDLLPVDPAATGRLPDGARLPVALGHRLVLVLARVRRAEPADPPVLAEALAAQRRLLEADPRSRTASTSRRGWSARKGLPPRERVVQDVEIPLDAHRRTSCSWFLREVPIEPVWLCPLRLRDDGATALFSAACASTPWPLYPLAAGRDLRQRRLLVDRRDRAGRAGRRRQPAHRGGGRPSTAGTSPSTPTPTTGETSSGLSTAVRTTTRRRSVTTRQSRLLDLYAKAVKRR